MSGGGVYRVFFLGWGGNGGIRAVNCRKMVISLVFYYKNKVLYNKGAQNAGNVKGFALFLG